MQTCDEIHDAGIAELTLTGLPKHAACAPPRVT